MILFYSFCYYFPDLCHVLKDCFRVFKLSRGRLMHPSLICSEYHSEFALESRNLKVEAVLITIKDSDTTLAKLLAGRVCIYKMPIWCHVGETFGPFNPDIAFNVLGLVIFGFLSIWFLLINSYGFKYASNKLLIDTTDYPADARTYYAPDGHTHRTQGYPQCGPGSEPTN